ncbi:MAG: PD-(D/E)XK nuclease family protein [Christensenella sp.]|nr:PD-(D/E)XK nuclease family protein [Christensenella sp.]
MRRDPLANVLVVVPPQSTYITEKGLIENLGLSGLMGVCVQSPARICDRVLEETYGRTLRILDSAGKSMLLRRILDGHGADLPALRKSAKAGDIPMLLGNVISELKSLDITPDALRAIETENRHSKQKFEDIAFVYEDYCKLLDGRFDAEDMMNTVIENLPRAQFLRGAHLFVHGFDIYNAQTVRFMKALMQAAEDSVISFYYADSNAPDAGVYAICDENRNKFMTDAIKMGLVTTKVTDDRAISADILHLEKNLYAYPSEKKEKAADISVMRAADAEQEVAAVAAQIAYLHEKKGFAFRDMAVICGNAQQYGQIIGENFTRARIPCFDGEKRSLAQSSFAVFLLTALELSQGRIKKDTLIAHAKTGFCRLAYDGIEALQNYIYSHVRDGFALLRPCADGTDPRVEEARKKLVEPVVSLRERTAKAKTAVEWIECLKDYFEKMHAKETMMHKIEEQQNQGLLESAEFFRQAYEKTMHMLDQAEEILNDSPVTKTQLLSLLKTGLEAQKIGVIPPGADEIAVGEVSYIRLDEIRALFVVGMNEGLLPDYTQNSDILADYERELMLSQIAGLAFTGNMEKQKLAIQKAFTKPSEKLFLSYVENGKSKPSSLLYRIDELFGDIKRTDAAKIAPLLKENARRETAQKLRAMADGKETEIDANVVAAVIGEKRNPQGIAMLERGIREKNSAVFLKPPTAAGLYGELSGNASRLERYYECPYKHFMQYGIRADVPQEYTINPIDIGNFAHDILDGMQKEIKKKNAGWDKLPEEDFQKLFSVCAQKARSKQEKYTLNQHNQTVLRSVEKEAEIATRVIRAQTEKGSFSPAESETWFSHEFPDGVRIEGKIDRIDIAEMDGVRYFNVVDYKTGARDFDLNRFAAGLTIQLIVYILAAQRLMKDAQFAGANYFHIHMPDFTGEPREIAEEYRMNGICGVDTQKAQVLFGKEGKSLYALKIRFTKDGDFDANAAKRCFDAGDMEALTQYAKLLAAQAAEMILGGDTRIRPYRFKNASGCDYCDFASVCMFDEQYAENKPREIEETEKTDTLKRIKETMQEKEKGGK